MGGLATPFTNHQQHTNTISTANHSVSKYRNQAQKLEEKNLVEHIKLIMGGWVGTPRFPHIDYREWSETTCTLAYIRRHVSSAWQPVSWQQMAFHMRDHASSLLFSREEPLFLFQSLFHQLLWGAASFDQKNIKKFKMKWVFISVWKRRNSKQSLCAKLKVPTFCFVLRSVPCDPDTNIALNKPTSQSSTLTVEGGGALTSDKAVDGNHS